MRNLQYGSHVRIVTYAPIISDKNDHRFPACEAVLTQSDEVLPENRHMYLIAIAWMYVVVMMTIAEAASPSGTLLGAFFTFVLYGLLPLSILLYILGTPGRKRRIKERERAQAEQLAASQASGASACASGLPIAPDAGSQTTTAAQAGSVAPVREEP